MQLIFFCVFVFFDVCMCVCAFSFICILQYYTHSFVRQLDLLVHGRMPLKKMIGVEELELAKNETSLGAGVQESCLSNDS